ITSLKWLETNNLFNNLIQRNQSAAFSSGKVRPNHETNINIIARRTEIGRASCRERVWMTGVTVSLKKKATQRSDSLRARCTETTPHYINLTAVYSTPQ